MGALKFVLPLLLGVATLFAGGLLWFASTSMEEVETNLQAIVQDLQKIASYAAWHHVRPSDLGGGDGAFDDTNGGSIFNIPHHLHRTQHAEYMLLSVKQDVIVVKAVSHVNPVNNVTVRINQNGDFDGRSLVVRSD